MQWPHSKFKAAIVGCGRIASLFAQDKRRGEVLTHAQAYLAHPETELVAACDICEDRLRDFGRRWKIKQLYTDLGRMLENEAIDILSIATPPETHLSLAMTAVDKGIKVIFCEKPMVQNLKEAKRLESKLSRAKVVFVVNHSRRWDPMMQKIAAYIRGGKLGRILCVDAYYTRGVVNTGPHLFDLLEWLLASRITALQTFSKVISDSEKNDWTGDLIVWFKDRFRAYVHGLPLHNGAFFEIDIFGEYGRIRIEDSGYCARLWHYKAHPRFTGYKGYVLEKAVPFGKGYQRIFQHAVENIVNALKGREPIACGFTEGKRVTVILDAVRCSIRGRGQKVKVPA